MIQITNIAPADAPAVAEIISQTCRAAYRDIVPPEELERFAALPGQIQQAEARLGDPNWYCRIARAGEGDAPCGIVSFSACPEDPGCAIIRQCFALPRYWGGGVDPALLEHALSELRGLGYPAVTLWVFEQNTRVRRFYEKFGFVPDGAETEFMGAIALRYRLELKQ